MNFSFTASPVSGDLLPKVRPDPPMRFITHSFRAANIAIKHGWFPGARYSNLRDVRKFERLGFLDIEWRDYNFAKHLQAVKATCPILTIARDVEDIAKLDEILDQASELSLYSDYVAIVPKDRRLIENLDQLIPKKFIFAFSVPSRYGGTSLPLSAFSRPTHLLGGHPGLQRKLAAHLRVVSMDCNRFTLDAAYGDFFDGESFRPHPLGGYDNCLEESIKRINLLWSNYQRPGI